MTTPIETIAQRVLARDAEISRDPYWHCALCLREVSPQMVKYDETHDGCGGMCQIVDPAKCSAQATDAPALAREVLRLRDTLNDLRDWANDEWRYWAHKNADKQDQMSRVIAKIDIAKAVIEPCGLDAALKGEA